MCGIAGLLGLDGESSDASALQRMIGTLGHRGPDAAATLVQGPIGLAHARLSIVDLSGGAQPMSNEDGTVWVVFNGELFNHVELRERLLARGHRFRTRCDTEVLVHAYEDFGEACVELFNGQWAFGLWDAREGKLVLSRDRLGVRPLYYSRSVRRFAFASEIKALFALPETARELDLRGLDQLFTFWSVVPPRTVFRDILQVPPGHTLVVTRERSRLERHWESSYAPEESVSEGEHAERLRDALVEATRIRLRADVPVGAYLSGGLDSAVVAAVVRQHTGARLRTFSVGFEDAAYDETGFQQRVIRHLGVEHAHLRCTEQELGTVFPRVVWHAESPTVRSAPAPMFLLSKLAHECGFKVVLTGEGSDEVLGGYDIFKEAKIRRFWAAHPNSRLRPLLLRRLYPYMTALHAQPDEFLRRFFHVRPEDLDSPFFSHLPRWSVTAGIKRMYSGAVQSALEGFDARDELRAALPEGYERWDPFQRAQFLEMGLLLPGYLLSTQGDRMAMAHSVEARHPFLDPGVVEVGSRIPSRLKMRALDEKYLLKKAVSDLIPPFLMSRPKQPYRAPDVGPFFVAHEGRARFAWVDDVCSERSIERAGVFDPVAVSRLLSKLRREQAVGARDGMSLVAVLSTQLLVEHFIQRSPEAGPAL